MTRRAPLPWSYSGLNTFITCPAQFHAVKVTKTAVDGGSEATEYGNFVHKSFELYVRDNTSLPVSLEGHKHTLDRIKAIPGEQFCERRMALTKALTPTEFFAPDVWSRCVIDFLSVFGDHAYILDYKTGKRVPSRTQLDLCALYVFHTYTDVHRCYMDYYMTELPGAPCALKPYGQWYVRKREDIPEMWANFTADLKQYARAFKEDIWQERPSGLCKGWCPVKTCAHWKQPYRR